ncbi:hypothetical protein CPB86DRAFT_661556, partial [Serendipita vermifera]
RKCLAMYFADQAAFHFVVTINSLFEISPLEGRTRPDPKLTKFPDVVIRQPLDFECQFFVRDEQAQHLIKTVSLD